MCIAEIVERFCQLPEEAQAAIKQQLRDKYKDQDCINRNGAYWHYWDGKFWDGEEEE